MGYPVIHFEINSGAATELQRFYAEAFGWSIDAENPDGFGDVRTNGVCPGTGFPGIDGRIWPTDGDDFVTFYVQVPDVEAALEQVERLGGQRIGAPVEASNVVLALFRDPRGNRIGLVRATPLC